MKNKMFNVWYWYCYAVFLSKKIIQLNLRRVMLTEFTFAYVIVGNKVGNEPENAYFQGKKIIRFPFLSISQLFPIPPFPFAFIYWKTKTPLTQYTHPQTNRNTHINTQEANKKQQQRSEQNSKQTNKQASYQRDANTWSIKRSNRGCNDVLSMATLLRWITKWSLSSAVSVNNKPRSTSFFIIASLISYWWLCFYHQTWPVVS